MTQPTTIGFDADDTLWHNERVFRLTETRFSELLSEFAEPERIANSLLEVEKKNLGLYGYGAKGFTLSLVETAISLTDGKIDARAIGQILAWGRDIMCHPVEPLPHVRETLTALQDQFELILITKGDLFDQERKLAESGLADFFNGVEIVSEKTVDTYRQVFSRHGLGADRAIMVGNSLRSDILPALDAGSWGVYVPYETTWALEVAEEPEGCDRYRRLGHVGELDTLVARFLEE